MLIHMSIASPVDSLFMDEETNHNFIDQKPLGLSEQIQAWRMSVNMSVEEVAKQLSVRPQIIYAFEKGDYSVFPARVFLQAPTKGSHWVLVRGIERCNF